MVGLISRGMLDPFGSNIDFPESLARDDRESVSVVSALRRGAMKLTGRRVSSLVLLLCGLDFGLTHAFLVCVYRWDPNQRGRRERQCADGGGDSLDEGPEIFAAMLAGHELMGPSC